MPTLTTFIQHSPGNSSHSREQIKGIQIKKEEGKLSLFAYIYNPKDATNKLLEFNEFDRVAGYKINAQK